MSWNMMGTITHDYSTPFIDRLMRRHEKYPKRNCKKQLKHDFTVNPLWKKAYAGRSEK